MILATTEQRLNPFPGLRPFRSDEHHLFFSREEQTASLLALLRENRFLAVVGTSGSGKSSLVRARMIAALHGGTMTQAGSTWEVVILRPGGNPFENLARALVEADLYDVDDPQTLPRLLATLNRSRFGLVAAAKQSDSMEVGTNLLVVVDQFEEQFRFRQQGVNSEEAAAAFVNLLLTASKQNERSISVSITMRTDYLGDCSEIPGLAEVVNDGEYLIPRLLRDQKRDAIEKPIGVGGAKISPLLVQRLLNDVGDDPDQLPVLQHALMRMWDVWSARNLDGRPIDFCDFESIDGLEAALSNHADEIYESLPDDRHRRACERIFKTLTEKGMDNRGIRRPTRLAALAVGAFFVALSARNRAVTAQIDAEHARRDSVQERTKAQELADTNDKLAKLAQKQRETARENDHISRTKSAQEVAAMTNSAARLRRMLGGLRPLGDEPDLRGWEWYFPNTPRNVAGKVINGKGRLYCVEINPSDDQQLALSGTSNELVVWDRRFDRELLALAGHEGSVINISWSPNGKWLASGSLDGTARIWDGATGEQIRELGSATGRCAFSPNGKRLAAGNSTEGISVWDLETDSPPKSFTAKSTTISPLAWSPDGSKLVVGVSQVGEEANDAAVILDAETGKMVGEPLVGHDGIMWQVAWSPDSLQSRPSAMHQPGELSLRDARLVSASLDGTVRVWHPPSGRELLKFAGEGRPVKSVAWSPDGMQIISGDNLGRIRKYDARGGYEREFSEVLLGELNQRMDSTMAANDDLLLRAGIHARMGNWDLAAQDYQTVSGFSADDKGTWYFSPWWLLGPFPEEHTWNVAATDPFAKMPDAGASANQEAATIRWQPVLPREDSGLGFRDYFDVTDHTSCYVYTRVYSPRKQVTGLLLGSDDTHQIWLNGQIVHTNTTPRAATRDQNACLVTLAEGWNTVVARVNNGIGEFALYLRLSNDPIELAGAFERSSEWDDALAQWDLAIEADPSNVALRVRRARAAHQAKHLDRALADYAAALTLVPNNTALIRRRAKLLSELDRSQDAMDEYRRLIELQPNDWGLRLEIGQMYALVIGPPDTGSAPAALDHPAEFLGRSLGFAIRGRKDLANADLDAAVILIRGETGSLEKLSQEVLRQAGANAGKGKFKYAIALLNLLVRIQPDSFDAVFERGQLYARTGQWQAAVEDLTRAIELAPSESGEAVRDGARATGSPGPRYQLAPLLAELGQFDRYRQHCNSYLAQFRDAKKLDAGRALQACLWCPDTLPDWKAQSELAERTLTTGRRPTVKGMYFYRAGRIKDALEWIPKTLTDAVPAEKARALCFWAMALMKDNQAVEAEAKLQEAEAMLNRELGTLQNNGSLSFTWHDWLAARALRRERWQEALADLKQLIELEPANSIHWLRAAPLPVATGNLEGYREHCRAMLKQFEGDNRGYLAERTAKVCLIRPELLDDLEPVFALAAHARTKAATEEWGSWYLAAFALAEVRAKRYDSAIEVATNNSTAADQVTYMSMLNRLALALAYHGTNQPELARQELNRVSESIDAVSAAEFITGDWHDLLIADILRHEA